MKTSTKLQKIVKAIENYRNSSDDCLIDIDLNRNTVKVIPGSSELLFGYMLSFIGSLVHRYGFIYYIRCTNEPCLVIHQPAI